MPSSKGFEVLGVATAVWNFRNCQKNVPEHRTAVRHRLGCPYCLVWVPKVTLQTLRFDQKLRNPCTPDLTQLFKILPLLFNKTSLKGGA